MWEEEKKRKREETKKENGEGKYDEKKGKDEETEALVVTPGGGGNGDGGQNIFNAEEENAAVKSKTGGEKEKREGKRLKAEKKEGGAASVNLEAEKEGNWVVLDEVRSKKDTTSKRSRGIMGWEGENGHGKEKDRGVGSGISVPSPTKKQCVSPVVVTAATDLSVAATVTQARSPTYIDGSWDATTAEAKYGIKDPAPSPLLNRVRGHSAFLASAPGIEENMGFIKEEVPPSEDGRGSYRDDRPLAERNGARSLWPSPLPPLRDEGSVMTVMPPKTPGFIPVTAEEAGGDKRFQTGETEVEGIEHCQRQNMAKPLEEIALASSLARTALLFLGVLLAFLVSTTVFYCLLDGTASRLSRAVPPPPFLLSFPSNQEERLGHDERQQARPVLLEENSTTGEVTGSVPPKESLTPEVAGPVPLEESLTTREVTASGGGVSVSSVQEALETLTLGQVCGFAGGAADLLLPSEGDVAYTVPWLMGADGAKPRNAVDPPLFSLGAMVAALSLSPLDPEMGGARMGMERRTTIRVEDVASALSHLDLQDISVRYDDRTWYDHGDGTKRPLPAFVGFSDKYVRDRLIVPPLCYVRSLALGSLYSPPWRRHWHIPLSTPMLQTGYWVDN